jgi:NADPH2:quinone reductase
MWTYILEQPGGQLLRTKASRPEPAAGHVLIRIHASGLNPLDAKIRAGKAAQARHPLPAVLGLDMAGVVEQVGPGVTSFVPGMKSSVWWAALAACRGR